ncbi:hypothetical protein ACJX0J_010248 [Zea mays]
MVNFASCMKKAMIVYWYFRHHVINLSDDMFQGSIALRPHIDEDQVCFNMTECQVCFNMTECVPWQVCFNMTECVPWVWQFTNISQAIKEHPIKIHIKQNQILDDGIPPLIFVFDLWIKKLIFPPFIFSFNFFFLFNVSVYIPTYCLDIPREI